MNTDTVSPEFPVVIPLTIRQSLGIQPGQAVQVIQYDNRVELIPVLPMPQARGLPRGINTTLDREPYTLDRPFADMVADYRRTGDGRHIWPAHFAGLTREYCQIEKLTNLDQLPPHGFYVSCLPVKIKAASAGWCRAIALVPEMSP